jgi:hypothetical protein
MADGRTQTPKNIPGVKVFSSGVANKGAQLEKSAFVSVYNDEWRRGKVHFRFV